MALRTLRSIKQERNEEYFPVIRVYIHFVEKLCELATTFSKQPEVRRLTRFMNNYFGSSTIVELQHWKDRMLETCLDIIACTSDGSLYLKPTILKQKKEDFQKLINLSGRHPGLPSYFFPSTKSYLRTDMAKAFKKLAGIILVKNDSAASITENEQIPLGVALPSSYKVSLALCNLLHTLSAILRQKKVPIIGTKFDGRKGVVVKYSFYDTTKQRKAVSLHLEV